MHKWRACKAKLPPATRGEGGLRLAGQRGFGRDPQQTSAGTKASRGSLVVTLRWRRRARSAAAKGPRCCEAPSPGLGRVPSTPPRSTTSRGNRSRCGSCCLTARWRPAGNPATSGFWRSSFRPLYLAPVVAPVGSRAPPIARRLTDFFFPLLLLS